VTAAFAAGALAFTAACFACLVYLHVARIPGYSPVRQTVSEYGLTAQAAWYRAQVRCAAAAAVCLAVALGRPLRVVVLLCVFAAARLAISFFPILSVEHLVLALVAFVSIASAAGALKRAEHGTPAFGLVMAALLLGFVVVRRSELGFGGLVERGFYAASLAWLALVAARLV